MDLDDQAGREGEGAHDDDPRCPPPRYGASKKEKTRRRRRADAPAGSPANRDL